MPTLPSEPSPPVSICELMPITSPAELISGPPELPGLIAASVWMTLSIVTPSGAWISRCRAETMPLVTVRCRSNGLPIATTGSPTSIFEESPSFSGWSFDAGASTFSSARSEFGSVPTTSAGYICAFGFEGDLDRFAAFDDVVVGEDVAFVVEHDAGAGGDAFGDFGFDEGDAVGVGLVDLVDGVAAFAGVGDGRGGGGAGGGDDFAGGGGAAAGRDEPGRDREQAEDGDDRPAQEGGAERVTSLSLEHGSQVGALCSALPKRA